MVIAFTFYFLRFFVCGDLIIFFNIRLFSLEHLEYDVYND